MSRRTGAKRMEQAMGAYFARCDGTRERVPQKGGGFSVWRREQDAEWRTSMVPVEGGPPGDSRPRLIRE